MERLTEKTIGCFEYRLKEHKPVIGEFGTYEAFYDYLMAVRALGKYEDAEEQGLLLRLPCKVGDVVYQIAPRENKIYPIVAPNLHTIVRWTEDEVIGEIIFLTREEAEEALKGGEGE